MSRELVIPTDDPNVTKAFDPYSVQGMINALTFFARDLGEDVIHIPNAYVVNMDGGRPHARSDDRIALVPTEPGLAVKHIRVDHMLRTEPGSLVSDMSIFNPDKVEYVEGGAIKFYARDPSAVLIIEPGADDTIKTTLKVTDIRHPDRVHGVHVRYLR